MKIFIILTILILLTFGIGHVVCSTTVKNDNIIKQEIREVLNNCNEEYTDGYGNTYIIFNTDKAVEKLYKIISKGD